MKVLVTSGPTREYIDAVRFISNASSGRMGHAVAAAAAALGHRVELVSGPCGIEAPEGVVITKVVTALEMREAVLAKVDDTDILVMTAAVSDWRVKSPSEQKIDKGEGFLSLELLPNPDILAEATAKNPGMFAVAFVLETHMDEQSALEKMSRKGASMVVLNTIDAMATKEAEFAIYSRNGSQLWSGTCSKTELAERLLDLVEKEKEA